MKPDSRIFKIAEKRFNLTKEKTWYIGDNYDLDMVGAKKVGWKTVWLNQNKKTKDSYKSIVDVEVNSTLDLYEYIQKF